MNKADDYPDAMAFYLAMRKAGVTEHAIFSAFEAIPRTHFLPPILQPFANNVEAIQLDEDVSLQNRKAAENTSKTHSSSSIRVSRCSSH